MRRGERDLVPSILGTAYVLSILRYAGYHPHDQAVAQGLAFLAQRARTADDDQEWATRHAVHTTLGLSEWHPQAIRDAVPRGLEHLASDVEEAIRGCTAWLASHQDAEGGWPSVPSERAHTGFAWTSSTLYALARLRERGHPYRDDPHIRGLITTGRTWLLARHHTREPRGVSWPKCERSERSVANTALAVLALSHRHLRDGSPDDDLAARIAAAGRDTLLDTSADWARNEAGEDDPEADDGWQHVVWSLAPRACLSAGAAPQDPRLGLALRHAFDRWGDRPEGGWYISGVGKTAYTNWSVVQLGQVLRLAISRQDPLQVVEALARSSHTDRDQPDAFLLLDRNARTAEISLPGRPLQTLSLAGSVKQWRLLSAFAETDGRRELAAVVLDQQLNHTNPKGDRAWGALKALSHTINDRIRAAFADPSLTILSCTTTGPERRVILHTACRYRDEVEPPHPIDVDPPDPNS